MERGPESCFTVQIRKKRATGLKISVLQRLYGANTLYTLWSYTRRAWFRSKLETYAIDEIDTAGGVRWTHLRRLKNASAAFVPVEAHASAPTPPAVNGITETNSHPSFPSPVSLEALSGDKPCKMSARVTAKNSF
jgi:hypothetical protein